MTAFFSSRQAPAQASGIGPGWRGVWGLILLAAVGAGASRADTPAPLLLQAQAQVDSQGIFLNQLATTSATSSVPRIRIGDAPLWGQATVLTRGQIQAALQAQAPELAATPWTGPERVRITRRTRLLNESELMEWLTAVLQRDIVRDRGELELRLTRPWQPVAMPDEATDLKLLDVPSSGIAANFIVRFELRAGREVVGSWQVVSQARIWREIWVATVPTRRGQFFSAGDVGRERRDIVNARELLVNLPDNESTLEWAEGLPAGSPLSQHSLRQRPIVHRGNLVEARILDGTLTISLKVEVLEEGAQGQSVRVRNPLSKREFRGKVQDEQTVLGVL
jgi:flagellar basal body P-ring formation protein FlgA